uniref:Kringle domain-containing protein n=1 Tax=Chromera velia CCMP2878 TaxID=1169474 RepID=A0A0G4HX54_9ALVE|eukprot:Cvel_9168.t1-p1 / transcript=Cvel_9168.t1 / gene=Cvel_9168 / organism=Chromera_velia_CCMP2878 / gene_product=hypothetical protein / transcript_product=hypothetical protein / location=Cvel_scaffold522:19848-25933(+) / protein_length=907 / sequence_SO=supercontig / SO=protein_coding / is_pseudo=false
MPRLRLVKATLFLSLLFALASSIAPTEANAQAPPTPSQKDFLETQPAQSANAAAPTEDTNAEVPAEVGGTDKEEESQATNTQTDSAVSTETQSTVSSDSSSAPAQPSSSPSSFAQTSQQSHTKAKKDAASARVATLGTKGNAAAKSLESSMHLSHQGSGRGKKREGGDCKSEALEGTGLSLASFAPEAQNFGANSFCLNINEVPSCCDANSTVAIEDFLTTVETSYDSLYSNEAAFNQNDMQVAATYHALQERVGQKNYTSGKEDVLMLDQEFLDFLRLAYDVLNQTATEYVQETETDGGPLSSTRTFRSCQLQVYKFYRNLLCSLCLPANQGGTLLISNRECADVGFECADPMNRLRQLRWSVRDAFYDFKTAAGNLVNGTYCGSENTGKYCPDAPQDAENDTDTEAATFIQTRELRQDPAADNSTANATTTAAPTEAPATNETGNTTTPTPETVNATTTTPPPPPDVNLPPSTSTTTTTTTTAVDSSTEESTEETAEPTAGAVDPSGLPLLDGDGNSRKDWTDEEICSRYVSKKDPHSFAKRVMGEQEFILQVVETALKIHRETVPVLHSEVQILMQLVEKMEKRETKSSSKKASKTKKNSKKHQQGQIESTGVQKSPRTVSVSISADGSVVPSETPQSLVQAKSHTAAPEIDASYGLLFQLSEQKTGAEKDSFLTGFSDFIAVLEKLPKGTEGGETLSREYFSQNSPKFDAQGDPCTAAEENEVCLFPMDKTVNGTKEEIESGEYNITADGCARGYGPNGWCWVEPPITKAEKEGGKDRKWAVCNEACNNPKAVFFSPDGQQPESAPTQVSTPPEPTTTVAPEETTTTTTTASSEGVHFSEDGATVKGSSADTYQTSKYAAENKSADDEEEKESGALRVMGTFGFHLFALLGLALLHNSSGGLR